MKPVVLAGMVFLATFSLPDLSGQTANQSNDREEILRLNGELTDAFARRDREALNRLLAPDYTMVSARGRLMTRDVYLENRSGSGPMIDSARFDQVSVRLYGTTAIVTSHYTAALSLPPTAAPQGQGIVRDVVNPELGACTQRDGGSTRTDTWIKLNGRWQMAATQLSPVGFPGAREAASAAICGANPEDLHWIESPAFPGARIAVLSGNFYNGPYVIRMQQPDGYIEQPHRHESDEAVSVTSGIVHIGLGDRVDRASAKTFRPGAYVVIPARTLHYSWSEGAVVEDIQWNGPAAAVSASERTEISLPRATLASYVGTYRFTPGDATVTITLDDVQLMAQLSGAPAAFPIFPESETTFFLKTAPPGSSVGVNARIEFVKSPNGEASGLIINGRRKATRVSR
jgi:hypothetical protein